MKPVTTSRLYLALLMRHQIALVIGLSLMLWLLESILVINRFRLFDVNTIGGANSLDQLSEKIAFLAVSGAIVFLLTAILFYGWYRFWRRQNIHCLLLSYHFAMLWGAFYLFAVIAKFKVLSYFNDTISFALVRDLSGGHLYQALYFILNEALGVIGFLGMFLAIYLMGHFKLKKTIDRRLRDGVFSESVGSLKVTTVALAILLLTLLVGWNQNGSDVRYALRQTLSFYWLSQIIVAMTDVDGDGYSAFIFPKDHAPFDDAVGPGAVDIPNNGIDEDGINGDLIYQKPNPAAVAPKITMPKITGNKARHVVLIVLESTRADVIGKTVGGVDIAPNMNAVAESGSAFSGVYSHSGYTTTSIKALLNQSLIWGEGQGRAALAEFRQKGYHISIFSGQSEDFGNIATDSGMKKYADTFFDADSAREDRVYGNAAANSNRIDARRVFKEFEKSAFSYDWRKPQFIYINLQCAHFPYFHKKMPHLLLDNPIPRHEIRQDNKAWLEASYWNAVQYADQVIGDIIRVLKQQRVLQDSLLIITGDHGESLFDNGFLGHGHAINDIQTEVPLVFNIPGIKMEQPIGQNEILNVARGWAGLPQVALETESLPKVVFQYIGSIAEPAQIATVDKQGVRTLFDFRHRKVWFSDLNRWLAIRPALADAALAPRAKKLINTWESLRWLSLQQSQ